MQIHLMDSTASRPLAQRLAKSKLDLFMMVLSELRETYWGANFTYNMFEAALTMLNGQSAVPFDSQVPQTNGLAHSITQRTEQFAEAGTTDEPVLPSLSMDINEGITALDTSDDFWQLFNFGDL